MFDPTRLINAITSLSAKNQEAVLSLINFELHEPRAIFEMIIDKTAQLIKNIDKRDILLMMKDLPVTDDEIREIFAPLERKRQDALSPDQIEYIRTSVYRNTEGNFRIIPTDAGTTTLETMGTLGLPADERIIAARLMTTTTSSTGKEKLINNFELLKDQHYEGPYSGTYADLEPNLKRIKIVSEFNDKTPMGFFIRDNTMYRNIAFGMRQVNPKNVSVESLERAFLLMYLVSGANLNDTEALYRLLHKMVRVPNSNTGTILYLNDFDAGGNGKSKFVSVLHGMFGDSFTAFEPHQLRFNISLMGRRLVHISEFEEGANMRELQAMIKAMTGRDLFQYEGKGQNLITAPTYQNFVISSNHYIYFDDAAIKRRLQNFHCSNLLHLLLIKYVHSDIYLNKLFGHLDSREIMSGMIDSLLSYILNDDKHYEISNRVQPIVLGSFKNPILRKLFASQTKFESFIRKTPTGSAIDLYRLAEDAKPEQYNYAAHQIIDWCNDETMNVTRDCTSIHSDKDPVALAAFLSCLLTNLDRQSTILKDKNRVKLQLGQFRTIDIRTTLDKYLGETFSQYKVPLEALDDTLIVG